MSGNYLDEFESSPEEQASYNQQSSGNSGYGGNNNNYNKPQNQGGYNNNNQNGGYNNNSNGYSKPQNNYNNQGGGNSYGNKQGGYNKPQGGYNKSGGNEDWKAKAREVQEPYIPVFLYIDPKFPEDVKENLMSIASRLINNGITVRYNCDDKDIQNKFNSMSFKRTEDYAPFNGFNEVEKSRFGFNTPTSNDIASKQTNNWEQLPKIVKIINSRNIRCIFGNNNKNNARCLITWSPDGATRKSETSSETGNIRYLIEVADRYFLPVFNINNPRSREELDRTYLRGNQ